MIITGANIQFLLCQLLILPSCYHSWGIKKTSQRVLQIALLRTNGKIPVLDVIKIYQIELHWYITFFRLGKIKDNASLDCKCWGQYRVLHSSTGLFLNRSSWKQSAKLTIAEKVQKQLEEDGQFFIVATRLPLNEFS